MCADLLHHCIVAAFTKEPLRFMTVPSILSYETCHCPTTDNGQPHHNLTFNFGSNPFFHVVKLPSTIRFRASRINAR